MRSLRRDDVKAAAILPRARERIRMIGRHNYAPYPRPHWPCLALVAFCFSSLVSAQAGPPASSPASSISVPAADDPALRALVGKLYAAYGERDLAGYRSLWFEGSTHFLPQK